MQLLLRGIPAVNDQKVLSIGTLNLASRETAMNTCHRVGSVLATAHLLLLLTACGGGGNSGLTDARSSPAAVSVAADTVTFSGPRANYFITRTSTGLSVTDKVGSDGTTSIAAGVRTLAFSDASVNLGIADKAQAMSPADLKSLIELYIAYFNRVPDANGLSYWIDQFNAGQTLEQIGQSFYTAALQYSSLTGFSATMSDSAFVALIYKNVLARSTPDQQGLDYWTTSLANGSQTRGTLIRSILSAAHGFKGDAGFGYVADLLDNKYTVASYVTVQQGLSYNSASDSIAKGMAIAAAVTSTDTSAATKVTGISDDGFSTSSSGRIVLSGTVAAGAPFAGGVVVITDNTGKPVGTATIDKNGNYSSTLTSTAAAPFVLTATSSDQSKTLVSPAAMASSGTVNITPLTDLISARLSKSGNPARLAQELAADNRLIEPARLAARKQEVVTAIQTVARAVGDQTDPLNGKFSANASGHDRLLDSLLVSIQPAGASSNIEIVVRQAMADTAAPNAVQFSSGSGSAMPVVGPVTQTAVIAEGTSALLADLASRMSNCLALPVSERVSNGTASNSTIIATACLGLFLNSDPSQYLKNGGRVGPSGQFTELFNASYTGAVVTGATYQFTRSNGDLVFSYTLRDAAGNTVRGNVDAVRRNGGVMQLIGDQYQYPGSVNAFMQNRSFINQNDASHLSSGYSINVTNLTDSAGNALFAKVVATAPNGAVLTLVPSAGSSFLVLQGAAGSNALTNVVRMARAYVDTANSGDPALRDISLFWTGTPYADAAILGMPNISNWRLDYYLASAPSSIAATQHYRTLGRPLTIAELRARPVAGLTDANQQSLRQSSVSSGSTVAVAAPSSGGFPASWQVPSGALAPGKLTVFGLLARAPSFNDQIRTPDSARTASVPCSPQGNADLHCSKSGTAFNFASGVYVNNVQLNAGDEMNRTFSSHYAIYTVAP